MAPLKKIFRFILHFIFGFIDFVLIYLFLSWLLPFIQVNSSFINAPSGVDIFVKSNGVHTDIVMPIKSEQINWDRSFPYSDFVNVNSDFKYIAIGWGDRGFFIDTPTWADLKFSTAFKAAFCLGTTAMHVTYKYNTPKLNEWCKKVVISTEQYKKLITYILTSFQLKNNRLVLIDHPGYSQQDRFYEANGTYSMFKTCNVWTGRGLKTAGVKIGIWTPFHTGIIEHLK